MRPLLPALMLALAALAVPAASASPDAPCPLPSLAADGACPVAAVVTGPSPAFALPCQRNASNDLACHAVAGPCTVDAYAYDVEDAVNHYRAECGCVEVDNLGRPIVRLECIQTGSSAAVGVPCQSGIAQTWCDATVGPCDLRVTPWTAWGDAWASADCRGGSMTRCHAEAHTDDPANPEHWCAV